MAEKTIQVPIQNYPKQEAYFSDKAKYKICSKGRRVGITRGAANNFIRRSLEGSFKKGLWVDTVNANIDRYVERYFMPALRPLPKEMWNYKKLEKILYIKDSYIDFRSADRPENIEGFGYDLAFLNEAGIILKDAYLWQNAIKPMLWDNEDAECLVAGTPKGGGGIFEELYNRGLDPSQPQYKAFHFTTFDNPYLRRSMIEDEIKELPEDVIRQEIYGEFLSDSGIVFRNLKNVLTAKAENPKEGRNYVIGVDLAKHQDFTVIAVYNRGTNMQVYQERFNQLDWGTQKERIKNVVKWYNNGVVYLDATGLGDPIADDLLREGIAVEPVKLTSSTKAALIEKAVLYIEQSRVGMLDLPDTVSEFTNFSYEVGSGSRMKYGAPSGFHDDIVIANCLAIWGLNPIYEEAKPEPEKTLLGEHYARITGGQKRSQDDWIEFEYEVL